MTNMSTHTSMTYWTRSGWLIQPSNFLGNIDAPPPQTADRLSPDLPSQMSDEDEATQVRYPEEFFELLEDLAIAKEAEEEYDRQGLEGTIPYTDYRTKWLGTDSSV